MGLVLVLLLVACVFGIGFCVCFICRCKKKGAGKRGGDNNLAQLVGFRVGKRFY